MKKLILFGLLGVSSAVYAGEIANYHQRNTSSTAASTAAEAPVRISDGKKDPAYGVSLIGLERTPCFGSCPVYSVNIKSDGTVNYQGEANVERKGKYTGHIDTFKYNRLAEFIRDEGFMSLEDNYTVPVSDIPSVYTSVTIDGKRKAIKNRGNAGPSKLWAIEQLIDKLVSETKWDEKADTTAPKAAE
jgi:hypothetical protein